MKREQAQELISEGLEQLGKSLASGRSDQLIHYLAVMSRFHQYSFGNLLLILAQRENATQVAGFHAWKKLRRSVMKGEKGIGIIAPMVYKAKDDKELNGTGDASAGSDDQRTVRGFKVVHVFDVSQTEGEELPEFASVTGEPGEKLTALENVVRELGIELEYAPLGGSAKGVSSIGKIVIDDGLESAERFAVLAHEASHELLHDKQRRRHDGAKVLETEAEAVALVVCGAFGLDSSSRSADYIQLYQGDEDTLAQSLGAIQRVAAQLIDAIEAQHPTVREPLIAAASQCRHSLYCHDAGSTWMTEATEHGSRIVCRLCGHFYGYVPETQFVEVPGAVPLNDAEAAF